MQGQRSPYNLDIKLGDDPIGEIENMSYKSCIDSIVFLHESIEITGEAPGGGGYNRCLVSVVSKSELVPSSEQIEQCVSSCWHKEQLLSRLLRIFTDVLGILPFRDSFNKWVQVAKTVKRCKERGEQLFVSIQSTMECFSNSLRMGIST